MYRERDRCRYIYVFTYIFIYTLSLYIHICIYIHTHNICVYIYIYIYTHIRTLQVCYINHTKYTILQLSAASQSAVWPRWSQVLASAPEQWWQSPTCMYANTRKHIHTLTNIT